MTSMIEDSLISIERASSNRVRGMNDPICKVSRIALVGEIRVLRCHIDLRKTMVLILCYVLSVPGFSNDAWFRAI